ncbi:MAG: TonB-dependent receptor [Pseudomonadales bacterium]
MSKKIGLFLALLGMMFPLGAAAEMEEVVVSATKRDSNIRDVPFSINAQTQQDIQRSGSNSIEDLARNVAGLAIQNLGPGQSQVSVRGVSAGQIVRDQPGVKEQVGVYLDESVISLSLFTPDLDLFDLNRVETLRGPQGTLFGSGSVGGTIRYITNQPDPNRQDGLLELNANTLTDGEAGGHIKGMINVPVAGGDGALRLVGYHTEYGGFIDALGEGGTRTKDVNSGNRSGIRVALMFQPTPDLKITPRLVYQTIEADGFNRQEVFNLYANPFTTTRPAIQLGEREQYLLLREAFEDDTLITDLTVEWSLSNLDVISITSYTDRDILVSRDASALSGSVSVDLGFPDAGVLLPSNLRDTTELKQLAQEVRVSSNSSGPLQWMVGVFYSDTERVYAQRLPTPGYDAFTDLVLGAGTSAAVANGFAADSPFNSDLPYDIEQTALFGELTYDVNDRLSVTVGGRFYDFDEVRTITSGGLFAAGDSGVVDKTTSDGFTPRVMLSYDINESVTFNSQISQGFRLGGVNDPLNPSLCTPDDREIFGGFQSYKDETLVNYEAGIKSNFGPFSLNAALFYADIDDLQVTLDAGSCSSRVSFNVPEAHSGGAELELSAQPSSQLEFKLAASVVQTEFDTTVVDGSGAVLGGVADGNRLASVPEIELAASARYSIPLTLFASQGDLYFSTSIQYNGDRITQPSDQVPGAGVFVSGLPFAGATGNEVVALDLELDSYAIWNANVGFETDTYDLILFVNNITDENANLSFDRERGGRARLGFRTNQPRMFGATWRLKFN